MTKTIEQMVSDAPMKRIECQVLSPSGDTLSVHVEFHVCNLCSALIMDRMIHWDSVHKPSLKKG